MSKEQKEEMVDTNTFGIKYLAMFSQYSVILSSIPYPRNTLNH